MKKMKLSGMWKNLDKNGQVYWSGNFGPHSRLLLFPNDHKRNEKDADLELFICEKFPQHSSVISNPAVEEGDEEFYRKMDDFEKEVTSGSDEDEDELSEEDERLLAAMDREMYE